MWILYIVVAVISLAAGIFATDRYYRLGLSKDQKELEAMREATSREAEKILSEAQKTGESKKRDLLLQAKEEIQKVRLEIEQEVRERREQLRVERQRLDQKESQLDRKQDEQASCQEQLDRDRSELDKREEAVAHLEEESSEAGRNCQTHARRSARTGARCS